MENEEYIDEELELIALKFDDFVADLIENDIEVLNIIDVSAIILSRLCRYSVEAGYTEQLCTLMDTAINSIDGVTAADIRSGGHTLQ